MTSRSSPFRTNSTAKLAIALGVAWLALLATPAFANIGIVLKKSFIDKYANRATISADYAVAFSHHKAKPASEDGDIHCSGTSSDIGMACVAEIVHASTQLEAIQHLIDAEGGSAIPVIGVWRIWPEHANGGKDFVQGASVDPITNTNPPHVFEIHPLTEVNGTDVRSSFTKVNGYSYKKAEDAFTKFESWPCELHVKNSKVTLVTNQIGYNYTRFTIELLEDPTHKLDDGNTSVFCQVPGKEEDVPLVSKVRCIFVDGSPPQVALQGLHAGDELKVIGVPRIDLALVRYRVDHRSEDESLLTRSLPYEMIIVGLDK